MAEAIKKTEAIKKLEKEFDKALGDPEIQKIYANGFSNAMGIGDIVILLKNSGKPIAVLNLSYTVAKTLALKLGALISQLEDATGNTIMTTDDIKKSLSKGGNE